MSKQTALTKAIGAINQFHVKYDHLDNMLINKDDVLTALTDLLPYEREVIEGAFGVGRLDGMHDDLLRLYDNSTDYFTKTFTDNGNEL
jgi:hypothetical protein